MPSPVAPVAIKTMPANPAPSNHAANATNAAGAADASTNSSNVSGDAAKNGGFAEMLLLQLGLGEQAPTIPTAPTLAVAASIVDSKDEKSDSPLAGDPAAALSALLASLGIAQPRTPVATGNDTPSDTTANATTAIDANKAPAVAANTDSGILGTATDKQTAKVAAFDDALLKADVKLDSLPKAGPEAPQLLANVHTTAHTPPAAAEAAAHVATPVRDPHWGAEFSQKVVWVAGQDKQTAQLTLNPPQLGPVEVTINVSHDQATAVFSSPHSEVRQAIETAMPQLREAFAAAGIELGQASVNSESFRQQQGNEQRPGQPRGNGEGVILADDSGGDASTMATTKISQGLGLVDTFA